MLLIAAAESESDFAIPTGRACRAVRSQAGAWERGNEPARLPDSAAFYCGGDDSPSDASNSLASDSATELG